MTEERELIRRLAAGRVVYVRAWGTSMLPAIRPGERLRVEPRRGEPARVDEVVLVAAGGGVRIHRVTAVTGEGGVVTRGDALRRPDPAVAAAAVLGRVSANLQAGPGRRWQRAPGRLGRWCAMWLPPRLLQLAARVAGA